MTTSPDPLDPQQTAQACAFLIALLVILMLLFAGCATVPAARPTDGRDIYRTINVHVPGLGITTRTLRCDRANNCVVVN